MTQTERLALRLVRVMAFVDASGALAFWVIDEDKKIEGGKPLNPPPQYECERQFIKQDEGIDNTK
jgi:hypothetical protein